MRADPRLESVPVVTMSGEERGAAEGEGVARLHGPLDPADLRRIVLSPSEAAV
jgi:hypothetical protein